MRRTVLTVVCLMMLAAPAGASDEVLATLPGARGLSAYGGWVAYSAPTGPMGRTRTWSLRTWHAGTVSEVAIAPATGPFDVDVGPDAAGRPTAVYSRCRPPRQDGAAEPPRGCDLYAVTLGGGPERRLAVSTRRSSEFAPSIWGRRIAFGRRTPAQRRANLMLVRGTRAIGLGRGNAAPCRRPCRSGAWAWPEQTDLGARAIAYLWTKVGDVGPHYELRVARLDGSRSRLAQSGFTSATCDFATPFSPNIAGERVLYGYSQGEECESGTSESFRRFDLRTARRARAQWTAPPSMDSLAWDGLDAYWLRRTRAPDDCDPPGPGCDPELVRSRGIRFRRTRGGEDRSDP